jgi:hypothetical protein
MIRSGSMSFCARYGEIGHPQSGHWETPFFMVYGDEVVLPPKVTMCTLRVQAYNKAKQDQHRPEDIDLVDERR